MSDSRFSHSRSIVHSRREPAGSDFGFFTCSGFGRGVYALWLVQLGRRWLVPAQAGGICVAGSCLGRVSRSAVHRQYGRILDSVVAKSGSRLAFACCRQELLWEQGTNKEIACLI